MHVAAWVACEVRQRGQQAAGRRARARCRGPVAAPHLLDGHPLGHHTEELVPWGAAGRGVDLQQESGRARIGGQARRQELRRRCSRAESRSSREGPLVPAAGPGGPATRLRAPTAPAPIQAALNPSSTIAPTPQCAHLVETATRDQHGDRRGGGVACWVRYGSVHISTGLRQACARGGLILWRQAALPGPGHALLCAAPQPCSTTASRLPWPPLSAPGRAGGASPARRSAWGPALTPAQAPGSAQRRPHRSCLRACCRPPSGCGRRRRGPCAARSACAQTARRPPCLHPKKGNSQHGVSASHLCAAPLAACCSHVRSGAARRAVPPSHLAAPHQRPAPRSAR
jgi:hypothetical protein